MQSMFLLSLVEIDDQESARQPTADSVYNDAEPCTSNLAEPEECLNKTASTNVNETDYDALYDRVHLRSKELGAPKSFVGLKNVQHPALIPELRYS
jgi:hypothetical protein